MEAKTVTRRFSPVGYRMMTAGIALRSLAAERMAIAFGKPLQGTALDRSLYPSSFPLSYDKSVWGHPMTMLMALS
jgi:hypothetical protein